jgi:Fic family protein
MKPFVPQLLPLSDVKWESLISHLASANRALAYYDGILQGVTNPELLLSPITTQEAVMSSRIEGTLATLGDVLKFEAGETPSKPERREDIFEIINYRQALKLAEEELKTKPFTLNLLKKLHAILLDSVRGRNMARGKFRSIQNWIGPPGTPMERAEFVPPTPENVLKYLDNWEKYYHMDRPDAIVQLAIVHAQFEIIHPFLDGNGRIGRMLIPLFLYEKKILSRPLFYLSAYLESHRDVYVERLRSLGQTTEAWNDWIAFFLVAVQEQAQLNAEKARGIINLYADLKLRVLDLTHSQFAVPLLDLMFEKPIFTAADFKAKPSMPTYPMIINLLNKLKEARIVHVIRPGRGRRSQILALPELINLCEGRKLY